MKSTLRPLIPAAILAGGAARRMSGADKGLVEYDGVAMVERVIRAVAPSVEQVVIISNNPGGYSRFLVPVYEDLIRGMGPLSGLYTAFEVTGASELLLVACDMPLVSTEMIEFILARASLPGDAVIPLVEGREQGLLAVYRSSAIEKFRERIIKGDIQFDEFRRGLDKSHIGEDELMSIEPDLRSFINVNSPEDIPQK